MREGRAPGWATDLVQDVRLALRLSRRAKGFSALSILVLASSIGISTALYSVVYEVLIRPLPYAEPERIVRISEERPGGVAATQNAVVSNLTFHAWKDEGLATLEGLAAYEFREHALALPSETIRVRGVAVTPGLLAMLGVVPAQGRFFRPDEAEDLPSAVVVVSDALWREVLGEDDDTVGSSVLLDGQFHTVVGIMPRGFFFPDREVAFWVPFDPPRAAAGAENPRVVAFFCLGRLKLNASAERAAAEGTVIAQRLTRSVLGQDLLLGVGGAPVVRVRTMAEESTADVRPALAVLAFGAVVLFFASCANVANLMIGRHLKRVREFAIRYAVGAHRHRLIRQLLIEHLILSTISGLLGIGLAWVMLDVVKSVVGVYFPPANHATIDGSALSLTVVLVFTTVLLCGLLPALRGTSGHSLESLLHVETQGSDLGLPGAQRLRDVLIVGQSAIAVSLLIVATLLGRSLVRLTSVDPGYSPANVLTVGIRVPGGYEVSGERRRLMAAVLARLRGLGPVRAAGGSNMIPLDNRAYLAGFPVRPIPDLPGRPKVANALRYAVTPGYSEALRLRLIDGRFLDEFDAERDVLSIVVNEDFARQYLPSIPVGTRLIWGEPSEAEIVGVVGNVLKDGNDRSPRPEFYVPMADRDRLGTDVLVVARTDPGADFLPRLISEHVRDLNPHATVEVMQLADRLSLSVARPRFATFVLGTFAGLSLFLSSAGLYGVMLFRATCRRREMAVRRALGATRANVAWLILSGGLRATGLGLACGIAATVIAGVPLLESMLFGIGSLDVVVLVVAPGLMALATVAACLVPAFRATSGEPAIVLRSE